MKLQEIIDRYGCPVWGTDIENGDMLLDDTDEGRFAARIATRVLAAGVRTGRGLCLIVVPDAVLYALPESWRQRIMRKIAQWRESWLSIGTWLPSPWGHSP